MKKSFSEETWRKNPQFQALCAAFLECSTQEEVANLLRDVGTLSELQAWSERLEVAAQLSKGKSYRAVAEETGASTTTVTRVAQFLLNGCGGYRLSLNAHGHHASPRGERSVPA